MSRPEALSCEDLRDPASLSAADFGFRITEKVRYSDTDRQGHVNNIAFSVFFEAGRVDYLFQNGNLLRENAMFVLVRSAIEFKDELDWPGEVEICSAATGLGRSSIRFVQALFQTGRCASVCESVMVQVDRSTRKSVAFTAEVRKLLELRGFLRLGSGM